MDYTKPKFKILNKRLIYEKNIKNWYAKILMAPIQFLADISLRAFMLAVLVLSCEGRSIKMMGINYESIFRIQISKTPHTLR